MTKFPLDLSKFKKVKSDAKTSVLQHPDGHQITIAHEKLTPKLKGQLDSIPTMEEAPDTQMFADGDMVEPQATPLPSEADQIAQDAQNQAAPAASSVPDAPQTTAQTVDASDPYQTTASTQAQIGALGEQMAGQQQVEAAKGKLGAAQAQQEQAYQQQSQQYFQAQQKANDDLLADRQKLIQQIGTGQINPRQYIENMSTGGKIMTGLGLVLGGMGAGLTHGPNLAFQYLQNQVDRDIEAQKANLAKNEGLLAANFRATGDLRAATDLYRLHTNDMLASTLRQEAGKAANPIAAGNMLNIAGMIDSQSAQLQHNLAVQRALLGGSQNQDQEGQFQTRMQWLRMNGQDPMAKDLEAKHVPGVGQASSEVPTDVRSQLIARQDLQNKIESLKQFAAQNSGSLNPATIAEGRAKAALVQDAYRRANAQGVFKESEKDFVGQIVGSDPTQFFEKYRAGKGYQQMGEDNLATLNNLKKGYGLPVSEQSSQAPQIAMKGGRQYQKVPGGWKLVQ